MVSYYKIYFVLIIKGGFFGDFLILHLTDSEKLLVEETLKNLVPTLSNESSIQYISDIGEDILRFGELEIYPSKYQVYRNGIDLEIGTHEFETLLLLSAFAGRVFSKEQIYRIVWKQEPINCENTIMCCISQLRKKIEPNPRKPTYIRTVRGIGYKFVAPED